MDTEEEDSDNNEEWLEPDESNIIPESTYTKSEFSHRPDKTPFTLDSSMTHARTIIHIDIDCFYAQVEMLKNPALRDKPLGIQQKFIVVTCNYKAREYGVTKLMTIKDAKEKCPQLVLVSGEDLTKYREMSYRISEFLQKYTSFVERLGFDENFLDVSSLVEQKIMMDSLNNKDIVGHLYTGTKENYLSECVCGCQMRLAVGSQLAADIRKALYEELGITSCAGISYNKLLAKLVGELHKPNQQTTLLPSDVQDFLTSLSKVRKIPGIGSATVKKLEALGIESVTDIQTYPLSDLKYQLGDTQALHIHQLCHGIDNDIVHPYGKPQTISDEDSYAFKKCCTVEDATVKIEGLLTNLLKRLDQDGRQAQTIRLSIRRIIDNKYGSRESKQCPLPPHLMNKERRSDMMKKLTSLVVSLLDKIVDLSKPFQITLMNIAFCNFNEISKNSISKFFTTKKNIELKERQSSEIKPAWSLCMLGDEKVSSNSTLKACSLLDDGGNNEVDHVDQVYPGPSVEKNLANVKGIKRKSGLEEFFNKKMKTTEICENQGSSVAMKKSVTSSYCNTDQHVDLTVLSELPQGIREEVYQQLSKEQKEVYKQKYIENEDSRGVQKLMKFSVEDKTPVLDSSTSSSKLKVHSDRSPCDLENPATMSCQDSSERFPDGMVCDPCMLTRPKTHLSDDIPPHIDKGIFYSLPSDIQRDILDEFKQSEKVTDTHHIIQKNKNEQSGSQKGSAGSAAKKKKGSNGNILQFLRTSKP